MAKPSVLPEVDVCILSDYAKGLVSGTLARHILDRARQLGKPAVVDPKGIDFGKYWSATLIKPNLHEAGLALGMEIGSTATVHKAGRQLLDLLHASAVLITRGMDGMTLFESGVPPIDIAAQAREVYDVTGAGDTVTATLAVALAAGASPEHAARLANRAASIVVARVGTTPHLGRRVAGRISASSQQESATSMPPGHCCRGWTREKK